MCCVVTRELVLAPAAAARKPPDSHAKAAGPVGSRPEAALSGQDGVVTAGLLAKQIVQEAQLRGAAHERRELEIMRKTLGAAPHYAHPMLCKTPGAAPQCATP